MEDFRRQGKIRYYGCSNWTTARMLEADRYCREKGYRGFIANQALYNIGCRDMRPMDDDTLVCADKAMQRYHREHPKIFSCHIWEYAAASSISMRPAVRTR